MLAAATEGLQQLATSWYFRLLNVPGISGWRNCPTAPPRPSLQVILLGTKGGATLASLSNPATLILVNDILYVVDCGYGVSRQLISAGVELDRLRYVFRTHHHSDHNIEYGPLLYKAW